MAPELDVSTDTVREQLLELVRLMVDEPTQIVLNERRRGRSLEFELQVAPQDVGKLIGRQGRTVRSLRTLLSARGEADGERYELRVLDS